MKEICDNLTGQTKNIVVFLPYQASHIDIAAYMIDQQINDGQNRYSVDVTQPNETIEHSEKGGTDGPEKQQTVQEPDVKGEELGSGDNVTGAFYKQQREKRAKGRRINKTVSETVSETPLEYKKSRRRTKSSSESLAFLEEDMSRLNLREDGN